MIHSFIYTQNVIEPNVISQTTHSLRRGLRKRELNDAELRDILSELMPYIRFGHILPLESECLQVALKRGLVNTLPPYMLGEDSGLPYVRGVSSWLRIKCTSGSFQRPRFFLPYVEEAKACLEERLGRPGEMIPNRSARGISHIPDALYMIDKASNPTIEFYSNQNIYEGLNEKRRVTSISQLPIIEQRILMLMKQREQELKARALGYRALVSSRHELTTLIQLRVVREFGLPDAAIDILSSEPQYVSYSVVDAAAAAAAGTQLSSQLSQLPAATLSTSATNLTRKSNPDLRNSYDGIGLLSNSDMISSLGSTASGLNSDKDIYGYSRGVRFDNSSSASECYLSNYSFEAEVSLIRSFFRLLLNYRNYHFTHFLSHLHPFIPPPSSDSTWEQRIVYQR